jgi:hypothetical protein
MTKTDWRAVDYTIRAMQRASLRIGQAAFGDDAYAAIGETVWWITILDKAVEDLPNYRSVIAQGGPIENTVRGLRSVRNRIGHELAINDYVDLEHMHKRDDGSVLAYGTWRTVPPPTDTRKWALKNHEAYVKALVGNPVWDSCNMAAYYLGGVADAAAPVNWRHDYPYVSKLPKHGGLLWAPSPRS